MPEGVVFNEEPQFTPRPSFAKKTIGGMTAWLVEKKIARDVAQANVILLSVAVGAFLLAGVALFLGGGHTHVNSPQEEELFQEMLQQGGRS